MVNLKIHKNIVILDKSQNDHYNNFVGLYLCKYEDVTVFDPIQSFGSKTKKFKSEKQLRQLYTEDENNIYFSRGLLSIIPDNEYNIIEQIPDEINFENINLNDIVNTLDTFPLRQDQALAVRKCLYNKRGIIQMPTATGKTAVIISVVKQLQKIKPNIKCLALAPSLSIADNLNKSFAKNDVNSNFYGHPDNKIIEGANVALVQTLMADKNAESNLSDIDAVFYDECLPQSAKILLNDFSETDMINIYENDNIKTVMSFNLETNKYESKIINRKIKTEFNQKFCRIKYIDPSDNTIHSISLTENHKVYTQENGYIPVSQLSLNNHLRFDNPILRNTSLVPYMFCKIIDIHHGVGKVAKYKYNIEVEDNHNYFADGILVSNCHHLKCDTWNSLNMLVKNAEYSIGFSALSIDNNEINKNNIRQLSYDASMIIGSTGRVLLNMPPKYYIDLGIIARPIFFRIKNTINLQNGYDWQHAVKFGIKSKARTALVAQATSIFSKYNYKILVLISEKEYGFKLGKDFVKYGVYNFGISYGGNTGYLYRSSRPINKQGPLEYDVQYSNKKSLEVINDFNNNNISVLIGTSHIDEGVDIENLDAVLLVGSGKKDRRIIQRVGRALRKTKTGKYAYIVDFTDSGNTILAKHSLDRLEVYKDIIGVSDEYIYTVDISEVEPIFKSLENIQDGVN